MFEFYTGLGCSCIVVNVLMLFENMLFFVLYHTHDSAGFYRPPHARHTGPEPDRFLLPRLQRHVADAYARAGYRQRADVVAVRGVAHDGLCDRPVFRHDSDDP